MQMVQVEFQYGTEKKLVWVDASWNLKPGDRVTFEEEGEDTRAGIRVWTVIKPYVTRIDGARLRQKWGLDLPPSQRTER